jgi:hypothetical protein
MPDRSRRLQPAQAEACGYGHAFRPLSRFGLRKKPGANCGFRSTPVSVRLKVLAELRERRYDRQSDRL